MLNKVLPVFVLLLSCTACIKRSGESGNQVKAVVAVGEIRGEAAISQHLKTMILDDMDPATKLFSIAGIGPAKLLEFRHQLGAAIETGGVHQENGLTPNPFGIHLWFLLAHKFGTALAEACLSNQVLVDFGKDSAIGPTKLKPSFQKILVDVCKPMPQISEEELKNLWFAFVGYANYEEAAAFARFWNKPENHVHTPKDAVRTLIMAMMLNPYFLMRS